MTATYTFDLFSSLDGHGGVSTSDWGGSWAKRGPGLLDHRLALYEAEQQMVFGATPIGRLRRCSPLALRSRRVTHRSPG